MRWTLGRKLSLGGLGLLLCVFIIGIVGILNVTHFMKSINEILDEYKESKAIEELRLSAQKLIMPPNDFLVHGDKEEIKNFEFQLHLTKQRLRHCRNLVSDENETKLLAEFEKYLSKVESLAYAIFSLDNPRANVRGGLLMEEMDALMDKAIDDIGRVLEVAAEESREYFEKAIAVRSQSERTIGISGLLVILLGLIGGIFFIKGITRPIKELVRITKKVSEGDLTVQAELLSNDEIGELSVHFNNMTKEIKRSREELLATKDYTEKIIASMNDMLIVTRPDGTIRNINQAVLNNSGYEEEKLLGRPIETILESADNKCFTRRLSENSTFRSGQGARQEKTAGGQYVEDFLEPSNAGLDEKGIPGQPRASWDRHLEKDEMMSCEAEYLTKEGKKIPVLLGCSSMQDKYGHLTAMVITAKDITNQKSMEEILKRDKETFERLVGERTQKLLEAHVELERTKRLSDIGTLAATVAHELRNPLATIRISAMNMKRKMQDSLVTKHLLNIEKKILESDQIISNLLFYSRIKIPHVEKINIYDILNECIQFSKKRYHKKKVAMRRSIGNLKNVFIEADPLQMKELFENILNNAYDAVSEETGKIAIKADLMTSTEEEQYLSPDEKLLQISFKDNGVGMAGEDINKAYEPFFTTKSKGTGLGLTVCHQIVRLHNGRIDIRSEQGKGTTISILLPRNNRGRSPNSTRS